MKEKYKILIAEDEALARELINHVLKENNYQPVIVENGKMALEYLKRESFPVVITDLDMPIMGGRELILEIQANFPDTIVIVETLHFESDIIIDIMKMGVFDYLIKPIKAEDLLLKVSRGLDAAILKKNHRVYEKEKLLRMESQLEWLKWQSKNLSNTHLSKNSFYDAVFENLKTNLSQGAGFGAIISISELICNSPKNEDNQYLIDAGIVDFLRENTMHAQKIIQTFGELDDLVGQKKFNLSMTVQEVYNLLKEEVEASKKFAEVKHHNIMLSDLQRKFSQSTIYTSDDVSYLRKVFNELIINALKFSRAHSNIIILFKTEEDKITISFLNVPTPENQISEEHQNLIFEPFYRLNNHVYEDYKTSDYGLGLTIVDKIVQKHNGKINAYKIVDHTERIPTNKVEITVEIPFARN